MAGFNRIILLGNLTRDPELRTLPSGTAVCEFGLAVNSRYTSRDGEPREEVLFIDATAFGRSGETLAKYLRKGAPVLVEGRLRLDSWEASDGSKRSRHKVTVDRFQFVGSRPGAAPAPAGEPAPAIPDGEDGIPF